VHLWRPELAIKEITVNNVMSSLMIDKNNTVKMHPAETKKKIQCTYTHM
jgi:hypothetical protein